MRPADKVVHEAKTYHRSCLDQILESNRAENLAEGPADEKSNLKDESSPVHKSPINSTNDLNDSASDQFYELINDKLSLKSLDDQELNFSEAPVDKIVIKVECCSQSRDSPRPEDSQPEEENTQSESNQLKSVSSNLSSLNPFDEDDANDEFFEMESSIASDLTNQKTENKSQTDEKSYPKDLNPFGSDEENDDLEEIDKQELDKQELDKHSSQPKQSMSSSAAKDYPDELNPFDENDETVEELDRSPELKPVEKVKPDQLLLPKNYSTSSLERFNGKPNPSQFKSFTNLRPNRNSFNQNYDSLSVRSLTPDGKWKSNKKRQAPRPPTDLKPSSINSASSVNNASASPNNASSSNTSSPILGSNKPHPNGKDTESTYHSSQSLSENEKDSLVSLTNSEASESKENVGHTRRAKKNKAPQLPTLIRFVTSIEEIERECDTIGDNLLVNSNSIREIEIKLKDNQTDKQLSKSQIKKQLYQFMSLVETKCSLAKRQAELMFMKSQNRLVNDQIEVETSLRLLYDKGAKSKTFEDLKVEEDLLEKLVDIVDRKSEIEENIVRIDKSFEFDKSVLRIKEYVDDALFKSIVQDYKSNHLVQSNIRNNQLMADVEKKKKHEKSKGFTLKKLSKTINKIV